MRSAVLVLAAAAAMPLLAGDLEARLLDPIVSELRQGAVVRAVVTRSAVLPRGTVLEAHVTRVRAVGLGLRYERASLALEFTECRLPDGTRHPLGTKLLSIDNAREEVNKKQEIRGILAADGPHNWVRGLWFRPQAHIFQRSLLGLTGVSGQAWSRFNLGPAGAVGLMALRLSLFSLPDPEIRIPAGADVLLDIVSAPPTTVEATAEQSQSELPDSLKDWINEQPHRVTGSDGKRAADVINFAFLGDEDTVKRSFVDAGWSAADPLNRQTFTRAYKAFVKVQPYPTAPVSPMHYRKRLPDLVFQRSLNTVAKRHHIRIWRAGQVDGHTVWLGAATHDVGIVFDRGKFTLTHRIDLAIDTEREKVITDLDFAGCVGSVTLIERPDRPTRAKKQATTDGKVAVLALRPCQAAESDMSHSQVPRKSAVVRAVRRVTLETRSYLLRGNLYYYGYRYARRAF